LNLNPTAASPPVTHTMLCYIIPISSHACSYKPLLIHQLLHRPDMRCELARPQDSPRQPLPSQRVATRQSSIQQSQRRGGTRDTSSKPSHSYSLLSLLIPLSQEANLTNLARTTHPKNPGSELLTSPSNQTCVLLQQSIASSACSGRYIDLSCLFCLYRTFQ